MRGIITSKAFESVSVRSFLVSLSFNYIKYCVNVAIVSTVWGPFISGSPVDGKSSLSTLGLIYALFDNANNIPANGYPEFISFIGWSEMVDARDIAKAVSGTSSFLYSLTHEITP